MEKQILTDPAIIPDDSVLKNAMEESYAVYIEFVNRLSLLNLTVEWHYYNDGKSWLGKVIHKKKNLCWLSVWNTGFKLTFFFTEKTIKGLYGLEIDDTIKKKANDIKPAGKLLLILLLVESIKAVDDALVMIGYKMRLK